MYPVAHRTQKTDTTNRPLVFSSHCGGLSLSPVPTRLRAFRSPSKHRPQGNLHLPPYTLPPPVSSVNHGRKPSDDTDPHACPTPAAPLAAPLAAAAAAEVDAAAAAASPAPPAAGFPSPPPPPPPPPEEDDPLYAASRGLLDSSSSVNSKRVEGNAFPLGNMTPSWRSYGEEGQGEGRERERGEARRRKQEKHTRTSADI